MYPEEKRTANYVELYKHEEGGFDLSPKFRRSDHERLLLRLHLHRRPCCRSVSIYSRVGGSALGWRR